MKTNFNPTWVYHNIMQPALYLAYEMEKHGVLIDLSAKDEVQKELMQNVMSVEEKIWDLAGEQFKLTSPPQTARILYNKLGLPIINRTEKGEPSTNEKTIRELVEHPKGGHEILPYIIEHRNLQKLLTSYVIKLPTFIRDDGRIHPNIFIGGTETGRWTIKEPALQTIPTREDLSGKIKKRGTIVRKLFVARPGYVLVSIDQVQSELRILGYESRDPELLRAAREGIDIHSVIASGIYNIPLDEFLAKKKTDKHVKFMRDTTKRVGFGRIYLGTDEGLMAAIPELAEIKLKDFQKDTEKYWERFPKIKEFQRELIYKLIREGEITQCFGRKRHLPQATVAQDYPQWIIDAIIDGTISRKIKDPDARERYLQTRNSFKEGLNAKIQGPSHDYLTLWGIDLQRDLRKDNFPAWFWNDIHDDFSFEVEERELDEFVRRAKYHAEKHRDPIDINMEVEVEVGHSWDKMKEYKIAA